MSNPSSGPPWYPGQPDPNQPQHGGYTGGPGSDPGVAGPYGPSQPYSGGPSYPQQPQQPYGSDPGYGAQPPYNPQESYTTEPPYSGQPYSGQPYTGQPYDQGYGAAPQPGYDAGYQQQPGYQQPGYQQPGYPPPAQPGYGTPQPSRGRGGLIALIAGAAVLLLLVCGIGGVVLLRANDDGDVTTDPTRGTQSAAPSASPTPTEKPEYPATIVLPDSLAGMTRLTDADLQRTADQIATELKTDTGADSAVAGYYAPSGDRTKAVAVIGATTRISDPEGELDDALGGDLNVTGIQEVQPGPLGGVVKCGNTSSGGTALTVCGWADGGSLALGIFVNRSLAESQRLILEIRTQVLRRG